MKNSSQNEVNNDAFVQLSVDEDGKIMVHIITRKQDVKIPDQ
ncbi:hypothetical protein [Photobacterium kishitanii]|nr:hypothetical protein [Photobacterium kishitanii]CEO41588.1 hypothetical protein PPBDW_II0919 [Photobacterium kishitanii]